MHSHPNGRLNQRGRLRLVRQHLDQGLPLAKLADDAGISLRCAYKWLARFRVGGPPALADRRRVRRRQRRTLDPQQLQQAVDLRHQRLHLQHFARLLADPFSTVARALSCVGLGVAITSQQRLDHGHVRIQCPASFGDQVDGRRLGRCRVDLRRCFQAQRVVEGNVRLQRGEGKGSAGLVQQA